MTGFGIHSHAKFDTYAKVRNNDGRKCATLCVFSKQRIHRSQMIGGLQSAWRLCGVFPWGRSGLMQPSPFDALPS